MSSKKKEKSFLDKMTISRENFIEFLASATPEEVNQMILDKGKPRKLIEPMIFFGDKKNEKA